MSNISDSAASGPDEDNTEWTLAEIRAARPALEVITEIFGPAVAEEFRRSRGRHEKRGGTPRNIAARPTAPNARILRIRRPIEDPKQG
jgi:hypothetical protein